MGNVDSKSSKGKKLLKHYWTTRSGLTLSQDARATKKIFQLYAGSQTAIIQKTEGLVFIQDLLEVSGVLEKVFEDCPNEVGFEDYIEALIESLFHELDLRENNTMEFSQLIQPELELLPFLESICQKMLADPNFSEKVQLKLQRQRQQLPPNNNNNNNNNNQNPNFNQNTQNHQNVRQRQGSTYSTTASSAAPPLSTNSSTSVFSSSPPSAHRGSVDSSVIDQQPGGGIVIGGGTGGGIIIGGGGPVVLSPRTENRLSPEAKKKSKGKEPLWPIEKELDQTERDNNTNNNNNNQPDDAPQISRVEKSDVRHFSINLDLGPFERWEPFCNYFKEQLHILDSHVQGLLEELLGSRWEKLYSGYITSVNCRGLQCVHDELKAISKLAGFPMNRLIALQLIIDFIFTSRTFVARTTNDVPIHGVVTRLLAIKAIQADIYEISFKQNGEVVYEGTTCLGFLGLFCGHRPNAYSLSFSNLQHPTEPKTSSGEFETNETGGTNLGENENNNVNHHLYEEAITVDEQTAGETVEAFGRHLRKAMSGSVPFGILLRHTLEKQWVYLRAVETLSTTKITRPAIITICGAKPQEGVLLIRKRKVVVHQCPLAELSHFVVTSESDYLTRNVAGEYNLSRSQKEIAKNISRQLSETEALKVLSDLLWIRHRSACGTVLCAATSKLVTKNKYPLVPYSLFNPPPPTTTPTAYSSYNPYNYYNSSRPIVHPEIENWWFEG